MGRLNQKIGFGILLFISTIAILFCSFNANSASQYTVVRLMGGYQFPETYSPDQRLPTEFTKPRRTWGRIDGNLVVLVDDDLPPRILTRIRKWLEGSTRPPGRLPTIWLKRIPLDLPDKPFVYSWPRGLSKPDNMMDALVFSDSTAKKEFADHFSQEILPNLDENPAKPPPGSVKQAPDPSISTTTDVYGRWKRSNNKLAIALDFFTFRKKKERIPPNTNYFSIVDNDGEASGYVFYPKTLHLLDASKNLIQKNLPLEIILLEPRIFPDSARKSFAVESRKALSLPESAPIMWRSRYDDALVNPKEYPNLVILSEVSGLHPEMIFEVGRGTEAFLQFLDSRWIQLVGAEGRGRFKSPSPETEEIIAKLKKMKESTPDPVAAAAARARQNERYYSRQEPSGGSMGALVDVGNDPVGGRVLARQHYLEKPLDSSRVEYKNRPRKAVAKQRSGNSAIKRRPLFPDKERRVQSPQFTADEETTTSSSRMIVVEFERIADPDALLAHRSIYHYDIVIPARDEPGWNIARTDRRGILALHLAQEFTRDGNIVIPTYVLLGKDLIHHQKIILDQLRGIVSGPKESIRHPIQVLPKNLFSEMRNEDQASLFGIPAPNRHTLPDRFRIRNKSLEETGVALLAWADEEPILREIDIRLGETTGGTSAIRNKIGIYLRHPIGILPSLSELRGLPGWWQKDMPQNGNNSDLTFPEASDLETREMALLIAGTGELMHPVDLVLNAQASLNRDSSPLSMGKLSATISNQLGIASHLAPMVLMKSMIEAERFRTLSLRIAVLAQLMR